MDDLHNNNIHTIESVIARVNAQQRGMGAIKRKLYEIMTCLLMLDETLEILHEFEKIRPLPNDLVVDVIQNLRKAFEEYRNVFRYRRQTATDSGKLTKMIDYAMFVADTEPPLKLLLRTLAVKVTTI
jgi:hypothetical protein